MRDPVPHPSPPLPPPREYGSPGTPRDLRPLIWSAVAAVVLAVAVVLVVVVVLDAEGDQGDAAAERGAPQPSASTTAPATPSTSTPATPAEDPAFRCWDDVAASGPAQCTRPQGRAGLEWVFPTLAGQRCAESTPPGEPAPVLRVLCLARLADGTTVQIGYFHWPSVSTGFRYYEADGMPREEIPGDDGRLAFRRWAAGPQSTKAALMYAREPYSVTVTVADPGRWEEALATVAAPRPPGEVRGAPAA